MNYFYVQTTWMNLMNIILSKIKKQKKLDRVIPFVYI